jgi:hypothetical protein
MEPTNNKVINLPVLHAEQHFINEYMLNFCFQHGYCFVDSWMVMYSHIITVFVCEFSYLWTQNKKPCSYAITSSAVKLDVSVKIMAV